MKQMIRFFAHIPAILLFMISIHPSMTSANTGVPICLAAGDQWLNDMTPDGFGGALLVWFDGRKINNDMDIYSQRIDSDIQSLWATDGVPVCTTTDDQWRPVICSDGAGGAIVAWEDERNISVSYDAWDVYAQKINANGDIQWALDGIQISQAFGDQTFISIMPDGFGGAYLSWIDYNRLLPDDEVGGLVAQRIDTDGNSLWLPIEGVQVGTRNTGPPLNHKMIIDEAGNVIIGWATSPVGHLNGINIYAQKLDPAGVAQWTPGGVPVCTAVETQDHLDLVSDGTGGVVVIWDDRRNYGTSNTDVYAQRLDDSGQAMWLPDGVPVFTDSVWEIFPRLIRNSEGNFIVAIYEVGTTRAMIKAQKLSQDGLCLWPPENTEVSENPYLIGAPVITPDNSGGAILFWRQDQNDERTNSDGYAQKLGSDGMRLWDHDGLWVASSPQKQDYHHLVADGSNGALFAWCQVGEPCDIYGLAVHADGVLPPECVLTPDQLEFQAIAVDDTTYASFWIRNTGGQALSGDVADPDGPVEIASGSGPFTLAAQDSLEVVARFLPTVEGEYSGIIETGTPSCETIAWTGETLPYILTMLVDRTGSMEWPRVNGQSRCDDAIAAAFCDLNEYFWEHPNGLACILAFMGTGLISCTPGYVDQPTCVSALDSLASTSCHGTSTDLADAICESSEHAYATYPELLAENNTLIITTDGMENGSDLECSGPYSEIGPPPPGNYSEGSWHKKAWDNLLDRHTVDVRLWMSPPDADPIKSDNEGVPIIQKAAINDSVFFVDLAESNNGRFTAIYDDRNIESLCIVDPSVILMDSTSLGTASDTTFTITNACLNLLEGEVTANCGRFTITSKSAPFSLQAGEALEVTVRFEPGYNLDDEVCFIDTGCPYCPQIQVVGRPVYLADAGNNVLPKNVILHQSYPNPFNPHTTISFELPKQTNVRIDIYDLTGKLIITLQDGVMDAGPQQVQWNGRVVSGRPAPSGAYYYRLQADKITRIGEMLLLK
jgi:FlgD Ig-like domain